MILFLRFYVFSFFLIFIFSFCLCIRISKQKIVLQYGTFEIRIALKNFKNFVLKRIKPISPTWLNKWTFWSKCHTHTQTVFCLFSSYFPLLFCLAISYHYFSVVIHRCMVYLVILAALWGLGITFEFSINLVILKDILVVILMENFELIIHTLESLYKKKSILKSNQNKIYYLFEKMGSFSSSAIKYLLNNLDRSARILSFKEGMRKR